MSEQEPKTDLEIWFDELWDMYPLDLCHKKKGTRAQAMKAARSLKPGAELRATILSNLREMIHVCRLEQRQLGKTDRWPFLSTWINQTRWEMLRDMERPFQIMERRASAKCQCGSDVSIGGKCWECYDRTSPDEQWRRNLLRQRLRDLGLTMKPGESMHDYAQRCREYRREHLGGALARKVVNR